MNKQFDARIYESPNIINFSLNNPPFFVTYMIPRSAVFLYLEIEDMKIEFSSTQSTICLFNKKVNFSNTTKWNWTGNGNSIFLPKLKHKHTV